MTSKGVLKLVDFGLAKAVQADGKAAQSIVGVCATDLYQYEANTSGSRQRATWRQQAITHSVIKQLLTWMPGTVSSRNL